GMAGRADILVPFVDGDWEGDLRSEAQTVSRTGFGDPTIRIALFFVGAPALTRGEFASFEPETIIGGIVRVRVPLGQYEADKFINLGSNRWSVSPQFGVSHVAGRFLLEAYAAAWFFSDNSEFLGTRTLAQNPLLTFQVHAGYLFRRGFWLAVSSRQSLGGATSVDGGDKTTPETSNRVGATLAIPIAQKYALKFIATTGLTATIGNDYDTFGVALQVVL
ncbi:MAG: transporter, partial [Rhodothermia bacterium]